MVAITVVLISIIATIVLSLSAFTGNAYATVNVDQIQTGSGDELQVQYVREGNVDFILVVLDNDESFDSATGTATLLDQQSGTGTYETAKLNAVEDSAKVSAGDLETDDPVTIYGVVGGEKTVLRTYKFA